ncbi:MAG: Gfo/Idh/MocA family oxidoreductase [Candidatus Ratteibacteria bacterium]|jgi:predicted dehydrogenase
MNILIIGGGMITQEVILPSVEIFFNRHGKGDLLIASRRAQTLNTIETAFPSLSFQGWPKSGTDPDGWKKALDALKPPAAVIVATPDDFHTQPVIESIQRGFDCIVEKPLCLTRADALLIRDTADSHNAYVYTDYHKRHDNALRALKYRYDHGEMGEVLTSSAYIEERREMPLITFARWCERSSPFEYIGCHYVDLFHYITGLKPKTLIAFGQKNLLPIRGKDAFDAVEALIEWENGSVQYVQTSWVLPDGNPNLTNQGFQMTCTEGEFRADNADRNSNFVTQSHGYERFNPYFCKPYTDWDDPERTKWEGYGIESLLQPLEDILGLTSSSQKERKERIATFERTRPLPRQALIATSVIEAVRISLAKGNEKVSLEKVCD